MEDQPRNDNPGLHTNGLPAGSFRLLSEVDPRIGVELLQILAREGIAAYSQPSTGSTGAYLNRRLPSRPMDSFFVDAEQFVRAREIADPVLAQHTAQTEAQAFEAIVAGLRDELGTDALSADPASDVFAPEPTPPAYSPRDLGPRDYEPEPEDEHYTPPPARRQSPLHQTTKWAILSMALGILLLVAPTLIGIDGGDATTLLGTVGILLGVGLLITRLRDDHQDPGGYDDGAVV